MMLLSRMLLSSWLVLVVVGFIDSVHGSLVLNSSIVNNGGKGRNLLRSSSSSHFPLEQSLTTRTEPLPSVQQLEPAAIPPRKLQTPPTGSVGYGIDADDIPLLYKVDLPSGIPSLIGTITGFVAEFITGLTFCPIDGLLYGISVSSPFTLLTLNTTNAVATPVVNVTGLQMDLEVFLLSFADDGSGQCQFILGTNGGSLFTFNATDGIAIPVGQSLPGTGFGGEVDCQGDFLWTSVESADTELLYKTNLSSTDDESELVGDTRIFISGLAFDCCNEQLYAFRSDGSFYTVNSTTGKATEIGDSIPGPYTAGAIIPAEVCPTPSPTKAPTPAPTMAPTMPPTTRSPTPAGPTKAPTKAPTMPPTTADKKCYYDEQADSHYSSSEFLAGGTEFHVGDLCKDLSYTIKVCCAVQEGGYNHPEESGTTSSSTTTDGECVTCDQCTVDQVVNDACCAWAWWDDDSKYNNDEANGNGDDRRNLNGIYEGGCITKYGDESQCCKCNDFYKCIGASDDCAEECKSGPSNW